MDTLQNIPSLLTPPIEEKIEEIEELILVGDSVDSTLASMSQVITHTNAFINTLRSAIDIKKIVYVPGNHDHTLWTQYSSSRYGVNPRGELNQFVTDPGGELVVSAGAAQAHIGENLLTIFFEYDYGPAWNQIGNLDFAIANPLYAVRTSGRTYVFTHGTHFKSIVTWRRILKRLVFGSGLEELLIGIDIKPGGDVRRASNMTELEEQITVFVDSLWPNTGTDPTSRSDQLWYLYTVLASHFDEYRIISSSHELKKYGELPTARIPEIKDDNESFELWKKFFLPHLLTYLNQHTLPTDKLTFVYGDTHDGGFREYPINGRDCRIYNLGAWVVRHERDHPPCHVFALGDDGTEYMLDVSFNNVFVLGKPIIWLAAQDFENRYRALSWILRKLLDLFG